MQERLMKKWVFLAIFLLSHGSFSTKVIEVIRCGEGEMGIRGSLSTGSWPEGFSFPKPGGKYSIKRLDHDSYMPLDPDGLSTWGPEKFTSVKGLPRGTRLDTFKFIVHGLELETMVDLGKDHRGPPTSFDQFVRATLNPSGPLEGDFVPFISIFSIKRRSFPLLLFQKS